VPPAPVPFWKRPRVQAGAAGMLAAASLTFVLVRPDLNPFRAPTPYETLVGAVGTNRTVEARLTGGFDYGTLRSPTRSSNASPRTASAAVLAAAARVQEQADRTPSAANLHAAGVARLVIGDAAEGVALLERAAMSDPGNPQFHSDLAAAYLERARATGDGEDLSRAAESAAAALKLQPDLREALFNQALAWERLEDPRAPAAWERYLQVDPESGWSAEARAHRPLQR
jgi:hypothetical protein